MNNHPKISVIIPVYNVDKLLNRCLESVEAQTLTDIELILIDDGSTDDSLKICHDHKSRHHGVEVIHKENGGVSSARNTGLKKATGEWIYFCDADDKLTNRDSLLTLYSMTKNVEMVVAGHNDIDEFGEIHNLHTSKCRLKGEIVPKEYIRQSFKEKRKIEYQGYLWTKLFKREIIVNNSLVFDEEIKFAEDMLFITQYCCCKEVKTININLSIKVYDYIHRISSVMGTIKSSYNPDFFTDFLAHEKMQNIICSSFNDNNINEAILRRLFNSGLWIIDLMRHFNNEQKEQKEYIEQILSRNPKLRESTMCKRSLDKLMKRLSMIAFEDRASEVRNWLHSSNCHFKFLNYKWKAAYIISRIAGYKGIRFVTRYLYT